MPQVQDIQTQNTESDSPVLNGTSSTSKPEQRQSLTFTAPQPQTQPVKTSSQSQETPKSTNQGTLQAFSSSGAQIHKGLMPHSTASLTRSPVPPRPKANTIGKDVIIGTVG